MIKWYAVKINSEVDFNEVLSILRCTGFRWCFELGIDETYSDFPNIKFIFFGKVRNNLRIEWSPRKKLLPGEQIIFKSELNRAIEYLKLTLHEGDNQD